MLPGTWLGGDRFLALLRGGRFSIPLYAMSLPTVYDERFAGHVDPGGHPERPERLEAVVRALERAGLWSELHVRPGGHAPAEALSRVHAQDYLSFLRSDIAGRDGFLNADTYYAAGSVEAAQRAAGGMWALTCAILDGEQQRGLGLVRPPGHHAEARRGKGFCLLNSVAVAAAEARSRGARVALVDFDVHHGDGTQQLFWDDPELLFISLHRHGPGVYPGTGAESERGGERALGATVNIPMPAGADRRLYLEAFDEAVGPALARFAPDLLIVSAGFDAHEADPLCDAALDDEGYDAICARICEWADVRCSGRLVAALEGGYHLGALGQGVVALATRMLGRPRARAERS
jgi:acetoin utilization deacetylase AcuC-like enzyme